MLMESILSVAFTLSTSSSLSPSTTEQTSPGGYTERGRKTDEIVLFTVMSYCWGLHDYILREIFLAAARQSELS